jgi:hypothetical protein
MAESLADLTADDRKEMRDWEGWSEGFSPSQLEVAPHR